MAKFVRFRNEDDEPVWGEVTSVDSDGSASGRLLPPLPAEHDPEYYLSLLSALDAGGRGPEFHVEPNQILPPVGRPPMIYAIGLNYQDHFDESNAARVAAGGEVRPAPTEPVVFAKSVAAVVGHGDEIVLPHMAPSRVDYEVELAVVIGREARNVPIETALRYIAYLTVGHDVSARDVQSGDGASQFVRGKSFDTFCPIGPFAVTGIDPSGHDITMRLNGKTMQKSNTEHLMFSVPFLVSFLSHCATLLPGTLLMTGTPGGVGFAMKPPVLLKPGDVTECEIDGIGVLRNRVVADKFKGTAPKSLYA